MSLGPSFALLCFLAPIALGAWMISWAFGDYVRNGLVRVEWQIRACLIGCLLVVSGAAYGLFSLVIFMKAHWHG
ncbi:hypothetical protein [Propionivibrio dicarboxylicus]|uniref:Uncharacterized protein n=1 Tax=Propionivibrio dicarboxylicus TaxID=83767 RepID=A0A1G8LAW9_9RHOO|nr:hypothetical protein [Propionivibrio dicarboxylicus]SDI52796.1 hypothetical protein SAMN05660652_03589 [Propionivibrio dicarboxylicus]